MVYGQKPRLQVGDPALAYLPSGQEMQSFSASLPVASTYVSGGQLWQKPMLPGEYFPLSHTTHGCPGIDHCPAGQLSHDARSGVC